MFGDIIEFRQRPLRPESKTGSAIAVFAELASAAAAVATRLVSLEGLLGAGTESTVRRVEILPFRSLGTGGGQGGAVVLLAGAVKLEARIDSIVASTFARQLAESAAGRTWRPLALRAPAGASAAVRGERASRGGGSGARAGSGGCADGDVDDGAADMAEPPHAETGEVGGAEDAADDTDGRVDVGSRADPAPAADRRRQLCELAVGSVARCLIEEQTDTTSGGAAPAAPMQSAAPSQQAVAGLRPADRPQLCPGAAGPPSPDVVRALSFAGCGRVWRVRDMRLVFPGREARPRCEAAPPAGDDERDPGPHWWLGGGW